jgi:hypothetical protein
LKPGEAAGPYLVKGKTKCIGLYLQIQAGGTIMRAIKSLAWMTAAIVVAAFIVGGCKGAAELANKAMDKTNQTLAQKAAYEFMLARMSTDYGKMWDMTTPEMHDVMVQLAKKKLPQVVKSGTEKKRISRLNDRDMYVAVMNAKQLVEPYPKMSNFSLQKDTWTFVEKKAEVVMEMMETQENGTKTTKMGRLVLHDVGNAWLVAEVKDEPAK